MQYRKQKAFEFMSYSIRSNVRLVMIVLNTTSLHKTYSRKLKYFESSNTFKNRSNKIVISFLIF